MGTPPSFAEGLSSAERTDARNYAWVPIEHATPGTRLEIDSPEGALMATVAPIPFLDPKKEIPAKS
jgi:hypothetical protein